MSKERPESKVIRKNGVKIADSIATGGLVTQFAARLKGEAFITNVQQFIVVGIAPFSQVTQMLAAVESRLKTTDTPEETLKCFIEILQAYPALEELAGQLIAEYNSYGGTAFQSSNSASGSSSGAGGSSSTGADTLLGEGDHFEIFQFLQPMETDKKQLTCLGQVMGLHYGRLKGMADGGNFLNDMILAWLRQEDDVMKRCHPTWRNLEKALRNKMVGQNGIASAVHEKL